jgi:hypothetical protein
MQPTRSKQFASPTRLRTPPDYGRLAGYLSGRAERTATLTFEELERLEGAPLSLEAYERRAWWEDRSRPPSRAWRRAGWHVEAADVLSRVVTFVRDQG